MSGTGGAGGTGRRGAGVAVVAVLVLTLAGCDAWPQYLGGPWHSGHNPGEQQLGRANVGRLREVWRLAPPASGDSPPAVVGGRVYSDFGAADAATGRPLPGLVPGRFPAVAEGVVVGCTHPWGATASDAVTGAPRWSVPDANCSGSGHTIADGVDFVGVGPVEVGDEHEQAAFDLATGDLLWRRNPCPAGERLGSPATVAHARAYVTCVRSEGEVGRSVVAVDAATGAARWSTRLATSQFTAGPVVEGLSLFVVGGGPVVDQGRATTAEVFSLDPGTGTVRWQTTIAEPVELLSPATDGHLLYVLDTLGVLRALDPATGDVVWTNWTGPPGSLGSPAVANGVVYTASFDGVVEAFDTRDGRRLVTRDLGAIVHGATPVVAGGTLYVTTHQGLVALRPG